MKIATILAVTGLPMNIHIGADTKAGCVRIVIRRVVGKLQTSTISDLRAPKS